MTTPNTIIYGETKLDLAPQDKPVATLVENMPMAEYHSYGNIAEHPDDFVLSTSMLKEMADCPQRFEHLYLKGGQKIDVDHINVGSAVHTAALEPQLFDKAYFPLPETVTVDGEVKKVIRNASHKIYKDLLAQASGRKVLTASDFQNVQGMAKALANHPIARGLLDGPGYIEASVFYTCPKTKLRKRVRPDWMRKDGKLGVNIKTSHSAKPDLFYKTGMDFGYDMGAAMELEAMEQLFGPDPERNYVLLVIEAEAPHIISAFDVMRPMSTGNDEDNTPTSYADVGATRVEKALARFVDCMNSGVWPGYLPTVEPMRVPAWMMRRILEKGE